MEQQEKQNTEQQKPTLAERLGVTGALGVTLYLTFVIWVIVNWSLEPIAPFRYNWLKAVHYWTSRAMLGNAGVMLAMALFVGLVQHRDVTAWFRRLVFTSLAFVVAQGAIGSTMWLQGGNPGQEVHLVYGLGAVLSLPFFIFVEMTSPKRPAMGSYMWGFGMLLAIIIRCIMTGSLVPV